MQDWNDQVPVASGVRFGPFELFVETGELRKDGVRLKFSGQPIQVLVRLVAAPGKLVTREELQAELWPGSSYGEFEKGLNAAVNRLRENLGDSPTEPQYIETIPRRGYRFIGKLALPEEKAAEWSEPQPNPDKNIWSRISALPRHLLWQVALASALIAVSAIVWLRLHQHPDPKPESLATERQITANPPENWVTGGAISPDGRHVVYHDHTGLYVRSIESGETHPITVPAELKKRIFFLSWVPGGDKLLADVSALEGWDIWEISVLGQSDPKLLFRYGWSPAVSPNGRTVAFANSDFGRADREIWIAGADGSDPKKVIDAEQNHEVSSPVWSPDGHWLAYINTKASLVESETATILVRPTVAGPARVLLADSDLPKPYRLSPFAVRGLAWCSDGRLVFPVSGPIDNPYAVSNRMNELLSLWQVRVDSTSGHILGKPSQITTASDFWLVNPTCAADGRRLSVVKARQWLNVNVAQLYPNGIKLASPRRLTLDDRNSLIGAWTPDSKAMLFESERNGKSQLFQQRIDSDSAEVVASSSGEIDNVATTPNGAGILYIESDSISGKGGESSLSFWLMRQPEAGGPPEKLMKLKVQDSFQCASKLNSSPACVLAEATEKQIAFYALDPLKGKGIQIAQVLRVPTPLSDGWSLSADGSHLAILNLDKQGPGILVVSVADGSVKKVPLDSSVGKPMWISWTADGMGFFLICRLPSLRNLVHVTSVGKMDILLTTDSRQLISVPLPSPDGKYLAFESVTSDGNIWVIH